MKSFAIIVVFGIIACAIAAPLTEEQIKKGQEHVKTCIEKTKVDPAVVQQLKAGDFSNDDESTQCFALCFLKEAGFVDANGNQQEDVIVQKLAVEEKDKPMIRSLVQKCKNVGGSSPCNKAFNAYKCYRSSLKF